MPGSGVAIEFDNSGVIRIEGFAEAARL